MTDLTSHTLISGPAVDGFDHLKDSQGQPLSSGDATFDRILAVARSLQRMAKVQDYLLDRVRLTGETPHKEHVMLYQMRNELSEVRQTLEVFFFGD
jgi:hypothetical protein